MTYFEAAGKSYVIWAQHNEEKISCLYLGEVHPAVLQHDGRIFVCFSASGTGPEYCVGVLEADLTSNLLSPSSWKKQDKPLLTSEDLTDEYGPGHNSFTKDENGNDVFVYHARSKECFLGICGYAGNDPLYDPCRHARLHTVTWAADGMPVLR